MAFGFTMPLFGRTDKPWRWLPAVVLVPYAVIALIAEIAFVVGLTSYSSLAWLYRLHLPLHAVQTVYIYLLVSSFFFFIFRKSYQEISPDSWRRLRLLGWGTSIAMTPALLLTIAVVLTGRTDFPDWLETIVSVLFVLFPLTLAYVIVVQRAMDVRVVVRQGLQYALAKNGMRVLQAAAILLVTLTAFALLQNRERTQKQWCLNDSGSSVLSMQLLLKGFPTVKRL